MSARWQRARVLPGNPTLPAGTELWVAGPPEPMPAEETTILDEPFGLWSRPADSENGLLRTHLVLPGGSSLYTRCSQVELVADFRDEIAPVDAVTVPGVDLLGLRVGRDPG
jgi:hypothetical protein